MKWFSASAALLIVVISSTAHAQWSNSGGRVTAADFRYVQEEPAVPTPARSGPRAAAPRAIPQETFYTGDVVEESAVVGCESCAKPKFFNGYILSGAWLPSPRLGCGSCCRAPVTSCCSPAPTCGAATPCETGACCTPSLLQRIHGTTRAGLATVSCRCNSLVRGCLRRPCDLCGETVSITGGCGCHAGGGDAIYQAAPQSEPVPAAPKPEPEAPGPVDNGKAAGKSFWPQKLPNSLPSLAPAAFHWPSMRRPY